MRLTSEIQIRRGSDVFQLSVRSIGMRNEPEAMPSISFADGVGARPAMALDIGMQRIGFSWRVKRAFDQGMESGDTFGQSGSSRSDVPHRRLGWVAVLS